MNLVIKNNNVTADEGADYVFKDARVNEGTIFMIEFSNKMALHNYDLSKGITDLADDTLVRSGITTRGQIVSSRGVLPNLTDDLGFPMVGLGSESNYYNSGIIIEGVGKYLSDNQPNSLAIVWLSMDMTGDLSNSRVIRLPGETGFNFTLLNPSASVPTLSMSLAGKSSFVNQEVGSSVSVQLGVEFIDGSTANRLFVNGEFIGNGSVSSGGFTMPSEDILAIGGITPSAETKSPVVIYSSAMHDLSVSGLTADQVIKDDYDYTNGIGEFEGMEGVKRPYANL